MLLGILLLAMLQNGLNLLGVSPYFFQVVIGLVDPGLDLDHRPVQPRSRRRDRRAADGMSMPHGRMRRASPMRWPAASGPAGRRACSACCVALVVLFALLLPDRFPTSARCSR